MTADQPPLPAPDADDLVVPLRAGERLAISRALTEVERQSLTATRLIAALVPYLGKAVIVGITGPPGAGKSTLVNALVRQVRAVGRRVGVLAVDPSSPVSGGAILGDRIRMTAALDDDGVFVRSLASRGALGGLSTAAIRSIDILDGAGFDLVLVETVGTGQSEIDIADVTDVRLVLAAPGLGDDIQAMKSGLLEIADILVVNKGDRPDAEQTVQQLHGAVSLRAHNRPLPVLKTTATTGAGLDALMTAIDERAKVAHREPVAVRRRRRARVVIARAAGDLITERVRSGRDSKLADLADALLAGHIDPRTAAEHLLSG
jgi:LAO/AO transport system kinase